MLTKWWKLELTLATSFGSHAQMVTKFDGQILATKFGFVPDCSDIVGALPVSAAPVTSSFSTLHLVSVDWAKTTARRIENHLSFRIWCVLYVYIENIYKMKKKKSAFIFFSVLVVLPSTCSNQSNSSFSQIPRYLAASGSQRLNPEHAFHRGPACDTGTLGLVWLTARLSVRRP